MRTRALGRARPGEWVSRARPSFTSTTRLLVQYLGSTSLIRSVVAFGIVVGALVLYRLGVFNLASKLYVDYVISGVTQKKAESDQPKEK